MRYFNLKSIFVASCVTLFLLFGILWHALHSSNASHIVSSMSGESVPEIALPSLANPRQLFSSTALNGHVSLLNVWASWCSACRQEHAMLMRIKNEYHIPIYGILYRDDADIAGQWLARNGNPYVMIGDDSRGRAAVELGIYGTPETFIVSATGKILYQHIGVLTESTWINEIYPIIQQNEHAKQLNG